MPLEREQNTFQEPVALEYILAMYRRAFGEDHQLLSVRELGGGLYNTTYLLQRAELAPIILRVSPRLALQARSERNLMRNEHAGLPFLAPLAPLLPTTLAIDFTHQIIERDYLFQAYREGEQWEQVKEDLTLEEQRTLWRQLGSILKAIHTVEGEHFSNAIVAPPFALWSQTVLEWLKTLVQDLETAQLDASDLKRLSEIAQGHQTILDQVTCPHLLHGDLWTVNLLIERGSGGPKIVAVLDSDRLSWGDPLADWTIFLLRRNVGTVVDAFWETYGQPEWSSEAQLRELIYQGQYLGAARLEQHRLHHPASVERSYRDMRALLDMLE